MKKLDLWRRRDSATALPPDAPTTDAALAAEALERTDIATHGDPGRGDDHEDTVPAAFYRSAG